MSKENRKRKRKEKKGIKPDRTGPARPAARTEPARSARARTGHRQVGPTCRGRLPRRDVDADRAGHRAPPPSAPLTPCPSPLSKHATIKRDAAVLFPLFPPADCAAKPPRSLAGKPSAAAVSRSSPTNHEPSGAAARARRSPCSRRRRHCRPRRPRSHPRGEPPPVGSVQYT
ncbi:hypothetical protein BRADI_1g27558v3 [Brachypodium distachyon]|uniref:Uncharacterized protein n=1 Tax=Brachypodium distachyon TaxID=15368 RepID=A0A0Q3KYI4_BRADI|nr:hypothetical protein BRADI_1g27558v3 [Brachypodium distachyon]